MTDTTLLSIAGILIFLLLGVVAYFLKGRDRRISKLEDGEGVRNEKLAIVSSNLDVISKRLGAGSDSFKKINETIDGLQKTQMTILTEYHRKQDFEKYEDRHEKRHEGLDKTIDGIKENVADMKTTLMGMDQKFTGGLKTMTDMLSKVVQIPTDPGDRE